MQQPGAITAQRLLVALTSPEHSLLEVVVRSAPAQEAGSATAAVGCCEEL